MKINETVTLNLDLARPSDTVPVWNTSNPEVCTIVVDPNGYIVEVTAVGTGKAEVTAVTNCDFGSGVREHRTSFEIVVEEKDSVEPVVETQSAEEPASPYWKDN